MIGKAIMISIYVFLEELAVLKYKYIHKGKYDVVRNKQEREKATISEEAGSTALLLASMRVTETESLLGLDWVRDWTG